MAMVTGSFCSVPLFFRNKASGFQGQPEIHKAFDVSKKNVMDMKASTLRNLSKVGGNFVTMTDLRDKISTFRDLLDFSPCVGSASVHQLLIWTLNDLYKLYPSIKPAVSVLEIERAPMHKALKLLCDALKSLGDMWTRDEWMVNCEYDPSMKLELADLEQIAMEILEDMIKLARERLFDYMDDDEEMREDRPSVASPYFLKALSESFSDNNRYCVSPSTPTSVLSEGWKASPPRLLSLRVQAVGKLNPIDVKRLSFHMFSHAVVQNPLAYSYKTVEKEKEESETKDVKAAAINKVNQKDMTMDDMDKFDEVDQECEMEIDCPNSVKDLQVKKIYGSERNSIDNIPATRPFLTLEASAKKETNVLALSLHKLPSSVGEQIEPLSQLSPNNGVQSQVWVPPSPNKIPSIPLYTSPPPPPPPMIAGTPAASPPPPPMIARAPETSPPPPPPPPTISRTLEAPPPPPMALRNSAPPPPPPMESSKGLVPPPPPNVYMAKGSAPPPSPPMGGSRGPVPPPPPFMAMKNGADTPPPPPLMGGLRGPAGASLLPPPGLAGALRPKKAATKLKRSPQMGNLYRLLKGKVEGSSLDGKSSGRKGKIGTPAGGKQGMADALAEMTKRSAYFQQIEEDFKNYSGTIKEVKVKLSSFQTSDMSELIKFHKYVESHLEKLTDETQVLARFEDFPGKKLEALRMAAALYSKLDTIVKTLENWQIVSPVGQLLDKAESYFNKIKVEMDALERTKDEESKRFQAQKITFDFGVLVRIKELMVDVSSHCMELALKEKRETLAKANENRESKPDAKNNGPAKMLWRSFQFAFRVYTFAGGHDDRADRLTRELAQEIETDPHH